MATSGQKGWSKGHSERGASHCGSKKRKSSGLGKAVDCEALTKKSPKALFENDSEGRENAALPLDHMRMPREAVAASPRQMLGDLVSASRASKNAS